MSNVTIGEVFTLQSLQNLANFLSRVEMRGNEVAAFTDCANRIAMAAQALQAEAVPPQRAEQDPQQVQQQDPKQAQKQAPQKAPARRKRRG